MPHKEEYTEFVPTQYPPFPDGADFKTVELDTISLSKLRAGDSTEQDRAFGAFKTRGFVYLELAGTSDGDTIHRGAENIGRVAESFFQSPIHEKSQYAPRDRELFGYKVVGATVTDKNGTKDTAEFCNVSKDDMTRPDDLMLRKWPASIMSNKSLFAGYCQAAHNIGLLIMFMLAEKLGVEKEEIACRHKFGSPAGDHVRLTRGPPREIPDMPEIQTPSHTDFGTITILMNWLGGLQVWSSSSRQPGALEPDVPGEWLWVKPKRNCAIVNLGDAAVKFTNGVLCSGRHRVVPAPGEQGLWPRYSIVYFVRPNNEARLKTLRGHGIPPADDQNEEGVEAKEWIFQQASRLGQSFLVTKR